MGTTITQEMKEAAVLISNTNILTADKDQMAAYWKAKVLVNGFDVRNGNLFVRVPAYDKYLHGNN